MTKKRYNIVLNPAIVAKIDYHAEQLDMSRSDLINRILYDCLRDFGDPPDQDPEIRYLEGQQIIKEVTEK